LSESKRDVGESSVDLPLTSQFLGQAPPPSLAGLEMPEKAS
jgi:hypothetical protein